MLRDWGPADIAAGITQQLFFRLESRNVYLPFAMPLARQSRHQQISRQSGLQKAKFDGLLKEESDGVPPQHHNIVCAQPHRYKAVFRFSQPNIRHQNMQVTIKVQMSTECMR